MKQCWPAPERNKAPLLEVLREVLPAQGSVLEIGSGSGQHVVHFAAHLPGLRWQPSDLEAENLASIRAWVGDAALSNVAEPVRLDVRAESWVDTSERFDSSLAGQPARFDAIFSANMIHIAPWECCVALFRGAARHLTPAGVLVTYGPYLIPGEPTAESNVRFDAGLRAQDPRWGVRDLAEVEREASGVGMRLDRRIGMPANNFCLVFRREQS